MRTISLAVVMVALSSGCAAYRVDVLGPEKAMAGTPPPSPVFVEPFSEATAARVRSAWVRGYYGRGYYAPIAEKPLLARPAMLVALQTQALADLQPTAGFVPTRALLGAPPPEDVVVARVTLLDQHVIDSNVGLKGLACGFGFLFPPFWIYDAFPVQTDEHLAGEIQLFRVPAGEVRTRIATIPGLPDPVFNMQGLLPFVRQPFQTTLHIERSYLAADPPPVQEQALVPAVADYLAGIIQSNTRVAAPLPAPAPAPAATPAAPAPAPAPASSPAGAPASPT